MDFMRDLQECQAEVFRRSEEKIKARKRTRNRILAVCVPLCLLLSLKTVTQVPEINAGDTAAQQTEITEIKESNVLIPDNAKVEIQVQMSTASQEDDCNYLADSSRSLGYFITLTDSQGIKTVYHLTENLLTNTETKETLTLTDEELLQLKADLGITD